MKTFVVICAFVFGANALTQEQYGEIMKKVSVVGNGCVQKENATPEDMAQLIAHEIPPSTHTAKCILACFYEHYKMMKPDGTFDKQAAIDAFHEIKAMDADLYGKILQIIDTCEEQKKITDDRCETASLMATCVKNQAEALGVTKEAFLVSES
ncbi:hypothetical protein Zmor_009286 [Zophobas morio]|uniref:Uncharacterized protein n=1 Tax=Zophobas morio TaxID=2755281 RepID=A0AA38MIK0_9CUCU|nr:hypothetical protein Zmor_009286 [Zophobas morio]